MPRKFKITVNNVDYDVDVLEISAGTSQVMPAYTPTVSAVAPISSVPAAAAAPTSTAPAAAGTGDQCAQMGGVVVYIHVKQGQSVNEGDVVVELEAMKMKVPVVANRSGQVTRILVAVGDGVENGQPLITIA
ncbi:biotin/lipoyl-containing protein [Propionivibrio sp.]|uniref:biotin/lipoyl-containing protein n=1 Tax=Propionivibrio sp. TaxID=2212460 RepID=UPI0025CB9ED1|nr:biotin/lipoyl-containing protein [Propionivibrio sp.]MBK7355734.1 acetyl-CoA carboxylase biotin carboxyl carrier protein subunit [Propionivibrio sp.]MBK8400602.1 acetyl-CoA carboxylase biotin carboxyl carrier protein subunit [Propionivibrio sp.]MBK8744325.1 acetyl-CoA carboxylase biotin carboxyl carrier protein subunit [Propionivibrio sp.]MBK8895133.1 acetyl-CoA carboxylase biotin carboxyl carrier protein subunit [Propionivibrio sp.]MBL0206961.1 acetyl-CoA carboxylase biotin carboxyl carrie